MFNVRIVTNVRQARGVELDAAMREVLDLYRIAVTDEDAVFDEMAPVNRERALRAVAPCITTVLLLEK